MSANFCSIISIFTWLNAPLTSKKAASVSFFLENESSMLTIRLVRLSTVHWPFRKPHWLLGKTLFFSTHHCNLFLIMVSSSLFEQDASESGLSFEPSPLSTK